MPRSRNGGQRQAMGPAADAPLKPGPAFPQLCCQRRGLVLLWEPRGERGQDQEGRALALGLRPPLPGLELESEA